MSNYSPAMASGNSRAMDPGAREMVKMQQQAVGASTLSALDSAINALHDEAIRYINVSHALIGRLETPRPAKEKEGGNEPECTPCTIGEALQDIYNILVNCNESLQYTIKRIDEQVGDLKILP